MTITHENLARLFDAQYADFDEDLPLWQALAERHGSPLLELGCGTGRVLLTLAAAGHDVHGLETNPSMLARAAARAASLRAPRPTLHAADLRDVNLPTRFALAIAPLNVMAELSDDDLLRSLERIRAHLKSQGILAMELPNPSQSLLLPTEEDEPLDWFVEPESGNPIQVSAQQRLLPDIQAVDVLWIYDEMFADGAVSRHSFDVRYHLRTPETLQAMLVKSGFREAGLFGDYDFGVYDKASKRVIALAAVT